MAQKAKKKTGRIILLVILAVILLIAGVIAGFSIKNNNHISDAVADGLSALRESYTVKELDAGEYADMRIYGVMKFHTDQYEVEGLGNLSVMRANMGFMQMVSFMITPYQKNVPLCTLDFMYIFGSRKSYVEFYDLVGDSESEEYQSIIASLHAMIARCGGLADLPASKNWYDSLLSAVMHKELRDDARNKEMFLDALQTYIAACDTLPQSSAEDAEQQLACTKTYANGLIENGGVSTDVFKKALGEDKTRDFFAKVFFGWSRYE